MHVVVSDKGELLFWQCSKAKPDCTNVSLFYWPVVCLNGLRGAWEPHRTVEISRRKASRFPMETLLKGFPKGPRNASNRPLSGPRKCKKIVFVATKPATKNLRCATKVSTNKKVVYTKMLTEVLTKVLTKLPTKLPTAVPRKCPPRLGWMHVAREPVFPLASYPHFCARHVLVYMCTMP